MATPLRAAAAVLPSARRLRAAATAFASAACLLASLAAAARAPDDTSPARAVGRRSLVTQDLIARIAQIDDQQVPPGMVNVKVGLLLPFTQIDSPLIRDLTISGTSAVRLAFAEVNLQQELLPGAWITLVAQDSFGLLPNSTNMQTNPAAAAAIYATLGLDQASVAAVIGDATSRQSMFSAVITSKLNLPQCSFSAGSSELSKKDQYSTFFRTVPPDRAFANVMVDLVANRGWKRFGILHSADILGDQMAAAAVDRSRTLGLNLLLVQRCEVTGSDLKMQLQNMLDANARIILLGAAGPDQTEILTAAAAMNMTGRNGFVWIVANDVADSLREVFPDTFNETWRGLLMVDNLLHLDGNPEYETFMDKWAGLDPARYPMAGRRLITQNEGMAYSCAMVLARGFSSFVLNASDSNVRLNSLGTGRARGNFTLDSWNTGYNGPAGPMVFDKEGDVLNGNFRILNVQDGNSQQVGTWIEGGLVWQTPPRFFDGTTTPPSDSPPSRCMNLMWDSIPAMIIAVPSAILMACCLVVGVIIARYREIRIFKVASPAFCIIELAGLLFAYAWVFLQIGDPSPAVCISRPLTIMAAYVLVLGGIVVKNQRIYHIFDNVYGSTSVRIVVKDAVLAQVCGTLFLVDMCLAVLMVSLDPPSPTHVHITITKHLVVCKMPTTTPAVIFEILLVAFNMGILAYATLLSYRTRNVAGMYSECKQIALCAYNVFLCTIVAIPSQFIPRDGSLAGFYLQILSVWVAATFTLVVLFGPKLWQFFRLWSCGRLYVLRSSSQVFPSAVGQFWPGRRANGIFRCDFDAEDGGRLLDFGFGVALDIDGETYKPSMASHTPDRAEYPSPVAVEKEEHSFPLHAYEGVLPMKRRFKLIPFLSLFTCWEMKKVIVIPAIRYCIVIGTDERAAAISYTSAQMVSRPGLVQGQSTWYGFKATGRGPWYDYVFQVQSRESLSAWIKRFDPTSVTTADLTFAGYPEVDLTVKSDQLRGRDKRGRRPAGSQITKTCSLVSSVIPVTPALSARTMVTSPAYEAADGSAEPDGDANRSSNLTG